MIPRIIPRLPARVILDQNHATSGGGIARPPITQGTDTMKHANEISINQRQEMQQTINKMTPPQANLDLPGSWIKNSALHPATNIAGRAWRNPHTGVTGLYGLYDYHDGRLARPHDCEWWFPLDIANAPRVDGKTNIPRVTRTVPA